MSLKLLFSQARSSQARSSKFFRTSFLDKSALRSFASLYFVRIYVGAALVLPMLSAGAIAQSTSTTQPSTSAASVSEVVRRNPRIDMLSQAIAQHPNNVRCGGSYFVLSFLVCMVEALPTPFAVVSIGAVDVMAMAILTQANGERE